MSFVSDRANSVCHDPNKLKVRCSLKFIVKKTDFLEPLISIIFKLFNSLS